MSLPSYDFIALFKRYLIIPRDKSLMIGKAGNDKKRMIHFCIVSILFI